MAKLRKANDDDKVPRVLVILKELSTPPTAQVLWRQCADALREDQIPQEQFQRAVKKADLKQCYDMALYEISKEVWPTLFADAQAAHGKKVINGSMA